MKILSTFFVVCFILIFVPAPCQAAGRQWIGVAPFANESTDAEADYIGFQAAEYISAVLSGFPDTRTALRSDLLKILGEWRISLADLNDETKSDLSDVGHFLALNRVVVGTFNLTKEGLKLTAKLFDVQKGEMISKAVWDAPRSESYLDAYDTLLSDLISEVPEFAPSVGFDARRACYIESWSAAGVDYTKALALLYTNQGEAALTLLKDSAEKADLPFPGYSDAAHLLIESDQYSGSVRGNIARNLELSEQYAALNVYRTTLKLLCARVEAILSDDPLAISGDPGFDLQIDRSQPSAFFMAPRDFVAELKPSLRSKLGALLSRQEIAKLGSESLHVSAPPDCSLLIKPTALAGGFGVTVKIAASAVIRFLDRQGETLYALQSVPFDVVSLRETGVRFGARPEGPFDQKFLREGWKLRSDGYLEIRQDEAAAVKSVNYSIDPGSVRVSASFPQDQDSYWRSFMAHAYRRASAHPLFNVPGQSSPIKAVTLADGFFVLDDLELGRIPLLPRNGRIAGFTRPVAAVYLSEYAEGSISAAWTGALSLSENLRIESPARNSVVYFEAPEPSSPVYGKITFTAALTEGAHTGPADTGPPAVFAASSSALLGNGAGWSAVDRPIVFSVVGKLLFADNGVAYSIADGSRKWDCGRKGYPLPQSQGPLFLLGPSALYKIDPETGNLLAEIPYPNKGRIFRAVWDRDVLFILSEFGGLEAFDLASKTRLWFSRIGDVRTFLLDAGYLYAGNGTVYDALSGAALFQTEGRGAAASGINSIVWENGVNVERSTGKRLWKAAIAAGTPQVLDGIAFFGGHTAIKIDSGEVLWKNGSGGRDSFAAGGLLFSWKGKSLLTIEPRTGIVLWSCYSDSRSARLSGDFLYESLEAGGLIRRDLSLFRRVLSPSESSSRGSLDAELVTIPPNATLRNGVYVSNIVRGGGSERAGLLCGDYLLEIDGRPVTSREQAADEFYERKRADPVRLKIARQDDRGSWSETSMIVPVEGLLDMGERVSFRPGFNLSIIDRSRLREFKLESLIRFDCFVVESVHPGSTAFESGLAVGDVLLQADSTLLDASFMQENFRRLYGVIASAMRGKTSVSLLIVRDSVRMSLPAFKP